MADNIKVAPSEKSGAVDVATDEVANSEGKITHYPIYKLAIGEDGEAILIDGDNPIPVTQTADDINRFSCLKESIDEMVVQMKILNRYMAKGFDEEIKEEDIL